MSIYQPSTITERVLRRFRPTRLYIKKCDRWYYFGKTTNEDAQSYLGSGTLWKRVVKKYGKENVITLWVSDWYHDPYELQKIALNFSEVHQIVESPLWANYKAEDGLDGGHQPPEIVERFASKVRGQKHTPEQNEAKSKRQRGTRKSKKWLDQMSGDKHHYSGDRYELWLRVCEHCGLKTNAALHGRWHGDRCKKRTSVIS